MVECDRAEHLAGDQACEEGGGAKPGDQEYPEANEDGAEQGLLPANSGLDLEGWPSSGSRTIADRDFRPTRKLFFSSSARRRKAG
jgi:hypothetical protein